MTLRVNNLSVFLGDSDVDRPALHNVSVEIPPRAVTAIVGPNGAGKTTLLRILAGLQSPHTGTVHLGDAELAALTSRERARRIAFVEQASHTELDLRVRDVVELGRIPHRGRWPAARDEGAEEISRALAACGVAEFADRRWESLSGGERQRVQLARALAQSPEILVLDEPTNHLDLSHQIGLLRTIRHLGITAVVALHDLDLAAAYSDRLLVLRRGEVVAAGAPSRIVTAALVDEVYGVQSTVDFRVRADRLSVAWHR